MKGLLCLIIACATAITFQNFEVKVDRGVNTSMTIGAYTAYSYCEKFVNSKEFGSAYAITYTNQTALEM